MNKSPITDALHRCLKGDWEQCYAEMHVNAVKLESDLTTLREQIEPLRAELAREKAVADVLRDHLKNKTLSQQAVPPVGES